MLCTCMMFYAMITVCITAGHACGRSITTDPWCHHSCTATTWLLCHDGAGCWWVHATGAVCTVQELCSISTYPLSYTIVLYDPGIQQ